jgi:hypothetical protein
MDGSVLTSASWRDWAPGLDNDGLSLGTARAALPGESPEKIHPLIRLFENPQSPLALPGAVSLARHDCIHIVLGRGLLNQDEAFVIGYTMGNARRARKWHMRLFRALARYAYPGIYRMARTDLVAYEIGIRLGRQAGRRDIHLFPFETHATTPLGLLRRQLAIEKDELRNAYAEERRRLPDTPASQRLP